MFTVLFFFVSFSSVYNFYRKYEGVWKSIVQRKYHQQQWEKNFWNCLIINIHRLEADSGLKLFQFTFTVYASWIYCFEFSKISFCCSLVLRQNSSTLFWSILCFSFFFFFDHHKCWKIATFLLTLKKKGRLLLIAIIVVSILLFFFFFFFIYCCWCCCGSPTLIWCLFYLAIHLKTTNNNRLIFICSFFLYKKP